MCQSLAEGGIRCVSHAKIALQNSENKLVDIVISESKKSGIELPSKEDLFGSDQDKHKLEMRLMENPLYKEAKFEKEIAETSYRNFRIRVAEAIAENDHSALKDILYRGNPEVRRLVGERAMIMDAAEQRAQKANPLKRPFIIAEGKKKAQWSTDSLKHIRSTIDEEVKMQGRIQKSSGSAFIVESPDHLASVRNSMVLADGKNREFEYYNEKFTKTFKNQIANENMRKNPQYQEALSSSSISSSESYKNWEVKHEGIKLDYDMTNENIGLLELQGRVAGADTPKGKAYLSQAKNFEKKKVLKIQENKALAVKQTEEQVAREKQNLKL